MCNGFIPHTGEPQPFYFPPDHPTMPGWFKGMEQIIRERGLWPEKGLPVECFSFRCPDGRTDCCCRRLLFSQPDFILQKSQLEELIESRGHICDFYPKYHCELNFIEQYWGAAKLRFRVAGHARTLNNMEKKVVACLDDIPLLQIRQYILFVCSILSDNCLSSFIDMPTVLPGSFTRMERDFRDLRLHGQLGNIMDIGHSHRKW